MRIVDIREVTQPISSQIRNAYIDFSKMTISLVAVVTDVVRDGRRVVGYGFNSNGRYGQGISLTIVDHWLLERLTALRTPGLARVMLAVSARTRVRVGMVRALIEAGVLAVGWLLGGAAGVGTLLYAFGIGPAVELAFRLLRVELPARPDPGTGRRECACAES